MKKKSHPEFVRALKARNLKITVVGTYENCLSRVAVRCDVCGWEWAPVGGSLLRGHGCPKCAGTMRKSHAEFVEELKSRRDDVIIVGPYVKALEKTRFRFLKCGHEWDVTPAHILNGRGCPLCAHSRRGASQRLTMERFLKRLHKIDRNLVVREGGKYVNYTTPIPLRCNACKYEYEVKPSDVVRCDVCGWEWAPVGGSLLRGHGCPKCAGTMRKSHAEFVEELKSRRDDVIIVGPYVKALEKTRFRFLKCGHEWDVTPAHILNGRGCPLCAHSRRGASQRLTMERFLKRLHKIDRNLVVREGGKYVNYTTPIPLRCNACKYEYEVKPSDVLHGGGCPNCHRACTSFPEQFIRHAFVRMLGESEVLSRDKTAAGVELDVCIPALRAAVEPGSWYWHRNLVERDREKRLLCERKGIRLITVYDHYDETAVPFDDCLVTPCDLASRRNMDKLVAVTKTLLGAFGLDSNLAAGEWETIRRRAELDSRRMTTEEFRAELAGINDKIEVIGEYTRASDKIRVRCKVCNHEWSVAPTTLRRGSGCASCAGRLKLTHERFVERLNLLHPEIVPLTEYVNSQTRMTFECRACGHVWSAQAYGLITKSRSSGCRKCSVRAMLRRRSRKVRCITTGEVFDTLREAAAKYGVSRSAISQCCSEPPKLKRAGGREWEYVDLLSGER